MKKLEDYLKKNKKTHIIFDFDETILEVLLPWDEWLNEVKRIGNEYDKDVWTDFDKGEVPSSIPQNRLFKKFGSEVRGRINNYTENFEVSRLEGVRKNDELIEFIKTNADNYIFSMWSSNSAKAIDRVLKDESLDICFKQIVSRDEVDYLKPDPDGFKLIDDGHTDIANYLFIGDSVNDEGAAKALGRDYFEVSF